VKGGPRSVSTFLAARDPLGGGQTSDKRTVWQQQGSFRGKSAQHSGCAAIPAQCATNGRIGRNMKRFAQRRVIAPTRTGRRTCRLRWNDGQDNLRGVFRVQVNGVLRDLRAPVVVERLTCVWVDVEPRKLLLEMSRRILLALLEHERRRIHLDRELVGAVQYQQFGLSGTVAVSSAHDAICNIEIHASREVGVGGYTSTSLAVKSVSRAFR